MATKLFLSLFCGLTLAAQAPPLVPSPVQDTLKAARAAVKSGDIEGAGLQYRAAFGLAIASDPALASGIAVELTDMLQGKGQTLPAAAFLMETASQLEAKGADALTEVPIANRLSHIAGPLLANGNAAEARQALEKSLAILRTSYGPDALCVANVLASLSRADHTLGDNPTAVQESTEAQRIRERNQVEAGNVRHIDSSMTPPRVQYKIEPEYSDQARAAHLAGAVLLSVVVAPDGAAKNIQVQMPLGMGLDQQAIDAVEQWKFSPAVAKADGQPVPVQATIEVNFRLL